MPRAIAAREACAAKAMKSLTGRKSWTDKLRAPARVAIKPAPMDIAGMRKGEVMLVPTPALIDAFMRELPAGRHVGVREMRRELASRHGAEVTCPIYTGYHVRTVAEAAYEALQRGEAEDRITPFWRVLDLDSPTTSRLACGAEFVRERRAREGLPERSGG